IHPNYMLNSNNKDRNSDEYVLKTRYTYNQNIYQYLKNGKKYFSEFMEITTNFDYYLLDQLKEINVSEIIKISDRDELYQINKNCGIEKVADFYIYIIENYPKFIPLIEEKMESIYQVEKN